MVEVTDSSRTHSQPASLFCRQPNQCQSELEGRAGRASLSSIWTRDSRRLIDLRGSLSSPIDFRLFSLIRPPAATRRVLNLVTLRPNRQRRGHDKRPRREETTSSARPRSQPATRVLVLCSDVAHACGSPPPEPAESLEGYAAILPGTPSPPNAPMVTAASGGGGRLRPRPHNIMLGQHLWHGDLLALPNVLLSDCGHPYCKAGPPGSIAASTAPPTTRSPISPRFGPRRGARRGRAGCPHAGKPPPSTGLHSSD